MKKIIFALIIGVLSTTCMAQSACLLGGGQYISQNEPATLEFWFGNAGPVDTIDFTIKDKSTGIYYHYHNVVYIPHRFEVYPDICPGESKTYVLTYARNRYGELPLDLNQCEVTIYVTSGGGGGSNGVSLYFNPPNVCENHEAFDLNQYFTCMVNGQEIHGQTSFEGSGIINNHFFDPSLAGDGLKYITAKIVYNGQEPSTTASLIVYDVPTLSLNGIPHGDIYDTTYPFVLIGNPSGGLYSGNGVVDNTFNPALAGVGDHIICYTYTTQNDCTETTKIVVTVKHFGTGVGEDENDTIITAYPNPTSGLIRFSTPVTVEVYNMLGVRVCISNERKDYLDISDFPCGTYNLHMKDENGNWGKQKIVKI